MNPYLMKVIAGIVFVAVVFGAGYKVATWRWSGKVEKAVAARVAAEKEAAEKSALEAKWRQDIKDIRKELTDMAIARDAAQARYDDAVSRPPEIVIEYRDRWRDIPTTIVSNDCRDGVAELFAFIHSLPERPQ